MKFTKIVFFITLMATNGILLHGMDCRSVQKNFTNIRNDTNLSEQDEARVLQEGEYYEQLILQERDNEKLLQVSNYKLLDDAIRENYWSAINSLIEKNINLSKEGAQDLLEYNMALKKLQRYGIGSKEEMNQKGLVAFLIHKGINVNQALREAITRIYPAVVEVLIQNGADVNVSEHNRSPLNIALSLDNSDNQSRIINVLLDAGADPKLSDRCGNIPENKVRKNFDRLKQTNWAQRILGNNPLSNTTVGGNPNDNKGMNSANKSKNLTQIILDKTLSEQDALRILQESGDYEQLFLKEEKNSIEGLFGVNYLLLQNAVNNNYQLLINFLVDKNINFFKKNAEDLFTDLMINKRLQRYDIGSEAERDQKKLLTFLIKKGIDVNRALGQALCNDCSALVVEILIERKADVNVAAYIDRSPLSIAISLKDSDDKLRVINALLGAGANTKVPDKYGDTPENIAQRHYNKQTDWAQRILGSNYLPESNVVDGNPDDNNPTPSLFNAIKTHKGFAFVGTVIGVGVVVWCCKKLYAKYQDYKNEEKQQEDDNEQLDQEVA